MSDDYVFTRSQHGDVLRKSDGEAGYGVYAHIPSKSMQDYYTSNGETAHTIRVPKTSIIDLTHPTNYAGFKIHADVYLNKLASRMPGYKKPVITQSNFQRFGNIIEDYVRQNHPWAKGYIVPHSGPGVPTGKQVVIQDSSIIHSDTLHEHVMTLGEFLIEAKVGNYVAVSAMLPVNLKKELDDLNLSVPRIPDEDLHATLVYSLGTMIEEDKINRLLHHQPEQFHGKISHVSKFDSQKKPGLCTIVLEISSPELFRLHHMLTAIGLTHTYEYKPHVSLYYDIPTEEADRVLEKINAISNNRAVVFAGYRVEPLK